MEEQMPRFSAILMENAVKKQSLEVEFAVAQQQLQDTLHRGEELESKIKAKIDKHRKQALEQCSQLKMNIIHMQSRKDKLNQEMLSLQKQKLLLESRVKEMPRLLDQKSQERFLKIKKNMSFVHDFMLSNQRHQQMMQTLLQGNHQEIQEVMQDNQLKKDKITSLQQELMSIPVDDADKKSEKVIFQEEQLELDLLKMKVERLNRQLDFIRKSNERRVKEINQDEEVNQITDYFKKSCNMK